MKYCFSLPFILILSPFPSLDALGLVASIFGVFVKQDGAIKKSTENGDSNSKSFRQNDKFSIFQNHRRQKKTSSANPVSYFHNFQLPVDTTGARRKDQGVKVIVPGENELVEVLKDSEVRAVTDIEVRAEIEIVAKVMTDIAAKAAIGTVVTVRRSDAVEAVTMILEAGEHKGHREKRRSRSKSPYHGGSGGGGGRDYTFRRRRYSPNAPRRGGYNNSRGGRPPPEDMTPEERDARTVFCMQLSARVRARDIEEFFSSVGKVTDVRLITDNKTRRSKGICYVEFKDVASVPLAMGLSGQKLLAVPIIVQPSQAEKNRAAATANSLQKGNTGPMRLYVGSLHFNITEDMLRGIFEPFGKFHGSEDAKKALEQLNGFELAGRPMKVNHVTERTDLAPGPSFLDSEELDKTGIDLGATGRLHLMAKLAEGTGMELPPAAQTALNLNPATAPNSTAQAMHPSGNAQHTVAPPIATQSFMLSNMFDISGDVDYEPMESDNETIDSYESDDVDLSEHEDVEESDLGATWDQEIRDDVIEECRKHGGVVHIFVDKASPQGNVYVKCPTINSAAASVNSLHGRFFAGKVITAAYVPLINYHNLFPDALHTHNLL
ncbi:RNA-binding protein 39 [Nymphon striatum]|nr:RNA-binding protein 39 [Nymphon striatum]